MTYWVTVWAIKCQKWKIKLSLKRKQECLLQFLKYQSEICCVWEIIYKQFCFLFYIYDEEKNKIYVIQELELLNLLHYGLEIDFSKYVYMMFNFNQQLSDRFIWSFLKGEPPPSNLRLPLWV